MDWIVRGVGHGHDELGHTPRLAGSSAAARLGTGAGWVAAVGDRRRAGHHRRSGEPMAAPGPHGGRRGAAPPATVRRPAETRTRPTRASPWAVGAWRRGVWLPRRPVDPPACGGPDRGVLWR